MEVFKIRWIIYDEEGNEEIEQIEVCCDTVLICDEFGGIIAGTY